MEEYQKVMKFLNENMRGSNYEVTKIYAVDNERMTSSFNAEVASYLFKQSQDPSLFKKNTHLQTHDASEYNLYSLSFF